MEIIESNPSKTIRTKLTLNNFTPFEGHFKFNSLSDRTEVTWADSGSMSYPWNIFNLFADKMMGKDFESGLANLKKHVESLPVVIDTTTAK